MKHFLFGMVFGELIFPLLGDVGNFIQSGLEVFTTFFQRLAMRNGVEIAKMKKEIETIVGKDTDSIGTRVMGFTAGEPNFIEEEEQEEEEDL